MPALSREARQISTDHWMFIVEAGPDCDIGTLDGLQAGRMVATVNGLVVGTARLWGETLVEVEVHDQRPEIDRTEWDAITEDDLTVAEDALAIYGPETTGTDQVWRVPILPGRYRCAVLASDLNSVEDDIGGIGDDHYRIILWPL